jgi:hypothetical protein
MTTTKATSEAKRLVHLGQLIRAGVSTERDREEFTALVDLDLAETRLRVLRAAWAVQDATRTTVEA